MDNSNSIGLVLVLLAVSIASRNVRAILILATAVPILSVFWVLATLGAPLVVRAGLRACAMFIALLKFDALGLGRRVDSCANSEPGKRRSDQ